MHVLVAHVNVSFGMIVEVLREFRQFQFTNEVENARNLYIKTSERND